ncbi:MAG: hypothetical protein OXO50_07070 [Caldilineaceae bacterium]|nr:hypothetical protein [Caldilineaceae bacterium]
MAKATLIAACVFLLNGCPFLPPSPYNRIDITNVLPTGNISLLPGQSIEESVTEDAPGPVDIIGASSELDGEVLTVTLRLRELPEEAKVMQVVGHWHDLRYRWAVHVNFEGDPLAFLQHPDYVVKASYYAPVQRFGYYYSRIPLAPWIQTDQGSCETTVVEASGNKYANCEISGDEAEVTFSPEDGAVTLVTRVPGITGTSTIAFYAYSFGLSGRDNADYRSYVDYAPRNADEIE